MRKIESARRQGKRRMEFAEVVAAVRYGARNLFRFTGRDSRRLFWPFGLCVVGLVYVVTTALAQATVLQGMFQIYHASQRGGNEAGQAFAETFARMEALWLPYAISEAVAVLLLAAAVTRRLHDRGWSGAWALIPLPFLVLAIVGMPGAFDRAMTGVNDPGDPQGLVFLAGPLAFLMLIGLGVLLALKGTPGPNRYGEVMRETA